MDWYLKVLKNYATFSGRARRKEFWMFSLFHYTFIALLVILLVNSSETTYDEYGYSSDVPNMFIIDILIIYVLATFIPTLAVTVRRLHDIGKSGWWYLITCVPYIGSFILLIFTCMDSEAKPNQWGENPKGIGNDNLIDAIGTE